MASRIDAETAPARRITAWIVLVSILVIASGMAYSLWWPSVVRHQPWYWLIPGDIWGTVRAAHWVGWGALSYVYSSGTSLVTLPGFHVLLTPIVMLGSALGLSESAPGLPPVPKAQEWLLVGPLIMACATPVLFSIDSLARRLDVSLGRRRLLAVGSAACVWPTIVIWGHPEDVAALALGTFALVAVLNGRLGAAGWLLGGALGMQLYTVALIPLFIGIIGWRKGAALVARGAVIPGFLLVAVLIPNFHGSIHTLFNQPNYPSVNHTTPWVLLAPKLGHGVVAAGPGRLVGLAIAIALGFAAHRYRHDAASIVWLAAVVLAIRCSFESVMDPYYVMPAIALALVLAVRLRWPRLLGASAAAAGLTVLTYFHPGMWVYWLEMTGVMAAMLVVTWPGWARRPAPSVDMVRAQPDDVRRSTLPIAVPG